ncbi:MAG: DUF1616 domain-containing protein [Anaerolineae bacterium]
MDRRSLDLTLILTVAVASLILVLGHVDNVVLRTAVGLPLVLIVPGYVLLAILYPAGMPSVARRILFSLGLSIAITAFIGFLLNLLPSGIDPTAYAVVLSVIALGGSGIAMLRRSQYLDVGRPRTQRMSLPVGPIIIFGLAAAIVTMAMHDARAGAFTFSGQPFTQLWALPTPETQPPELRLGVYSDEDIPLTYDLKVVSKATVLQEWPSIALKPGETFEVMVPIPPDQPHDTPIEAVLYREDQPQAAYRQVVWWPAAGANAPATP